MLVREKNEMTKLLLILMVMGLWSGCGKEIEVVVEGNTEYEIYRDETNNKPIKHGYYKEYYPDKSYKTTGNFVDGEKKGKWVSYDEDGKVKSETNFVDGKEKVTRFRYYGNEVELEVNYVDRKKEGKFVMYYESGKVMVEGNFVDDEKEGKWVEYDEEGNITDEDIWKDGECVESCE